MMIERCPAAVNCRDSFEFLASATAQLCAQEAESQKVSSKSQSYLSATQMGATTQMGANASNNSQQQASRVTAETNSHSRPESTWHLLGASDMPLTQSEYYNNPSISKQIEDATKVYEIMKELPSTLWGQYFGADGTEGFDTLDFQGLNDYG